MYVCDVSIRPKCVFLAATIICPNVSLALLCFTAKQGCPEREEKNCATQTANPREILRTRNLGGGDSAVREINQIDPSPCNMTRGCPWSQGIT